MLHHFVGIATAVLLDVVVGLGEVVSLAAAGERDDRSCCAISQKICADVQGAEEIEAVEETLCR
eukprot:4113418-Heterocapsa_arctica.AAC.1